MSDLHRFPHLLSPGRIGALELRNRMVMCPMGDLLANPDGTVSDRQVAYYEARARGGAALLLVGSVAVSSPDGTYHRQQLAAAADRHSAGLRGLAERVHHHGAKLAAQLVHTGRHRCGTTRRADRRWCRRRRPWLAPIGCQP